MSIANYVSIEYWLIISFVLTTWPLSTDETPVVKTGKHNNYPIMKWLKYHDADLYFQDADGKSAPSPHFLSLTMGEMEICS